MPPQNWPLSASTGENSIARFGENKSATYIVRLNLRLRKTCMPLSRSRRIKNNVGRCFPDEPSRRVADDVMAACDDTPVAHGAKPA